MEDTIHQIVQNSSRKLDMEKVRSATIDQSIQSGEVTLPHHNECELSIPGPEQISPQVSNENEEDGDHHNVGSDPAITPDLNLVGVAKMPTFQSNQVPSSSYIKTIKSFKNVDQIDGEIEEEAIVIDIADIDDEDSIKENEEVP
eukprot:CAMPEP_0201577972 /NCGR_PEP_ID=MMETSP0190_2-20130828/24581_1 /ASSEMBLY_ACC=CAM_ASM_000263 /TAXON_ID=37353 /ORGANISM="Rosalina sp." /LENGTH=143 /DNA_ID=CAMNT_0048010599 /DNA_START=973 /DNA_END=1404 /DNA_ORIENTATION=+